MTITLKQAKALKHGDILHMPFAVNADGTPRRFRVNGKVKTWKRSPHRVQVPIKHGLWVYGYVTEHNLNEWCLTDSEAEVERERYYDRSE